MERDKASLRRDMTARRAALDPAVRAAASAAIAAAVSARFALSRPAGVLTYAAMRDEVDPGRITAGLLAAGIPVAYPLIDWTTRQLAPVHLRDPSRLVPGRFGVPEPPADEREPFDPAGLTVVLTPGLAFDRRGYRLGYGAGMYDGLFARLPATVQRWGLAFAAQVVAEVPAEPHDERLDAVVTESDWLTWEARHG